MARNGIHYTDVKQAAIKLLSQGAAPSVQKIRDALGTGSNTTIAEHLKVWREEYATKEIHHLPSNMPKELIAAIEVLWQTAMEQAENQLCAYKQTIETEHEKMLQANRDNEKVLAELKEQLVQLAAQHNEEIKKAQQLSIDLALANDRLENNQKQFIEQKNYFEERLKRTYEEKERILVKQEQLQSEIIILQEKLGSQTEKYQQALSQQQLLHEQSENRWLKLIDQTKTEAAEARKKYDKIMTVSEDEKRKLNQQLLDTQRMLYEKNTQIKHVKKARVTRHATKKVTL